MATETFRKIYDAEAALYDWLDKIENQEAETPDDQRYYLLMEAAQRALQHVLEFRGDE